jgi:uncharacterized protein YmfQ (DUF2313 family)
MTGLPNYTVADFTAAFQGLKPTGAVWPRDPDTDNTRSDEALMPTYVRSWQSATNLVVDAFPSTAVDLLPEWEGTLGLPDPCAGPDPTIALRQAHVVARLTQSIGPSIAELVAFAGALGYPVTIQEFIPARAGSLVAGGPLNGVDWAFTWRVHEPATEVFFFLAGAGNAGDPLATWGSTIVQCEMTRIAPAHTIPQFAFGS